MTGTSAGSMPVSSSQAAVALPEIRTMSPIQPLSITRHPTDESIMTGSSVNSNDSFTTVPTSLPSPSPNSPTASRFNGTSSHSLRKSISVDSFIKNRPSDLPEPGPSSGCHSRDYTRDPESGLDNNILEGWNSTSSHTGANGQQPHPNANNSLASRILGGRARGHSLSGPSPFDHDDLYLDDSEHERVSDMARLPLHPSHRSHPASSSSSSVGKGKGKGRLGHALLLPPRAPTLSNASSTSSLSSIANSAVFNEGVPPVPLIPPHHQRRPNAPEPLVMPRRARSGSFGAKNGQKNWPFHNAAFSIAIVGASGCGKTTVIRKGLNRWGVSDESICTVATPNGRLRYGSRTITAPRDEEKTAHVFELDSDGLNLDTPEGAWPKDLPTIDGILVCYDASNLASFARVPDLLACYHALHLSVVAIACKCDLEKNVFPNHASERAAAYNVGLVEVTALTDGGKKKMRNCFQWLIRAIERSRRGDVPAGSPYRNPASPDALNPPWAEGYGHSETRSGNAKSRVSTPSAGSPSTTTKFRDQPFPTTSHLSGSPGTSTPTARSPSIPTSPARVKSTNDLITEVERSRQEENRESSEGRVTTSRGRTTSVSVGSNHETLVSDEKGGGSLERNGSIDMKDGKFGKGNDPPPMPWATLEELLERLFFLAVSGDDPTFIRYFFITYRKFATPRSVLLGMQKRIRQLNQEHSNLLLGSYAQMRICDLLMEWIETFPSDFAVPGTAGAITALVKQISSNPCTLHYGSDILPFLDEFPNLQDTDASWSIQAEDSREDSDDDGLVLLDDEEEEGTGRRSRARHTIASTSTGHLTTTTTTTTTDPVEPNSKPLGSVTRDRTSSLPLNLRTTLAPPITTLTASSDNPSVMGRSSMPKNSPKELVKLSDSLQKFDLLEVAQQITKMQNEIFLAIEPRQWLRYTMGDAKSDPAGEPISASANFYNQLANWVSSLILAHEKVRLRERQVERFVELAGKLRMLNNYVGLRAVMSGINNATYPNDEILTMFRTNKIKQYQQFLGWDILLNSQHNHRAYRLALRHTTGPCIPDMEVHTFDMVRANESNPNYKLDDPTKIHWGKFTLMARMITMLQGLQDRIRSSGQYNYPERTSIREMLNSNVMDEETMRARVRPPPDDAEPIFPLAQSLESPHAIRNESTLRRLLPWP